VQSCSRWMQCENVFGCTGKIFSRYSTAIPTFDRTCATVFLESVSRNRKSYYREKYFWIDPRFQSGSAARAERKPRWSEHDEDVRDKMQEAGASAEIPRGCMPRMRDKMQLPRGPTFLQQFYSIRTVSIVRIRRAIILIEVSVQKFRFTH